MSETEPGLAGSGPDSALLKVLVALREFSKVTAEPLGEDVCVLGEAHVQLEGTRGVGELLGVTGRLSGTVSPFRAEQGTSIEFQFGVFPNVPCNIFSDSWLFRGILLDFQILGHFLDKLLLLISSLISF